MDSTLIRNARTAAYVAVWNAGQGSPVPRAIPLAMEAAREIVSAVHLQPDGHLLRAAVWDAIWTVADDDDDWTADHFCIVSNISSDACADLAGFNALEYIGDPGALYAMARAAAWRGIIAVRTYDAWVEAYELCLRQAREALDGNHQ